MGTPQPPPGGKEFLEAAKAGDIDAMKPLLLSDPALLSYNGKVRLAAPLPLPARARALSLS